MGETNNTRQIFFTCTLLYHENFDAMWWDRECMCRGTGGTAVSIYTCMFMVSDEYFIIRMCLCILCEYVTE